MESEQKGERVMSVRVGRFSHNPEEACNMQLFFDDAAVQTKTHDGCGTEAEVEGKY